ncbi:MAG TPA: site-2 protease family protein [Verrucomicrobiae bacterium]|nr:site-2 protease family protein [Verrucomicrobiae bacterium]
MLLPVRRSYRLTIEKLIAAPRERVWAIYRTNLSDPESKALHEQILSFERTEGDPPIESAEVEQFVGGRRRQIVIRNAILLERPPEIIRARTLSVGGRLDPYGPNNVSTTEFLPHGVGTRLRHTFEGELATLGQRLVLRRQFRKYFDRLVAICERKPVAPTVQPRRQLTTIAISVLAIASFGIAFGWKFGIILSLALVVHEFGHWLAMRLTGQPAPRVMLLPFLGGVTIANHPHKTYFNDAFCALMGAGFSAVLMLPLLLLMVMNYSSTGPSDADQGIASIVAMTAFIVGSLNLLQLLPFLPLDGGQVLRAIMQSFSARWAKYVLLIIGAIGVAACLYAKMPLMAGFVGIGVLQSWHMPITAGTARPMSRLGVSAIIGLFLLTAAIHTVATGFGAVLMRQLD